MYKRYHIEIKKMPNLIPHPHRFLVRVKKYQLAKLLIREIFHYKNLEVVKSRPCVYGVFSGPIGGFAPREKLCVGCLRCTTQYPDMCTILPNRDRMDLGDEYFTSDHVNTLMYEADTGRVPIKGQGYRGKFGGEGWDGMWTDMSEIVRPTRDGIHGREFISTEVDIGEKPAFLTLNEKKEPIGNLPKTVTIPLPILFDQPAETNRLKLFCSILKLAAEEIQTYAILPLEKIHLFSLRGPHVIPLISSTESLDQLHFEPRLIEIGNPKIYQKIHTKFPNSLLILRSDFEEDLYTYYLEGVRIFHLTADEHGRSKSGKFVLDLIREVHQKFVQAGCREEVTLIGSGGMIAAEHIPKAIMCGLDAVALNTPLLVALQAKFEENHKYSLPSKLTIEWGKQRLKNLAGSWRDQLLEIMGAMGLREVRRLRGEMGRAMFQKELEREAYMDIMHH